MREGPDWLSVSSFRRSGPLFRQGPFLFRSLSLPFPPLAGKRLFFISDLHVRQERVFSFPRGSSWAGTAELRRFFHAAAEALHPDLVILGGDLASETVLTDEALEIFASFPGRPVRIAIPGNWEYKHVWTTAARWKQWFREAGIRFLLNECFEWEGLRFFAADDFKSGKPVFPVRFPDDGRMNILLTHNPDNVPDIPPSLLKQTRLILSGHTHGGQIRLPGFGAFYCSTRVWKRFESGLYRNHATGTELAVSDGIGTSGVPFRLFCPPSALCVCFP